MKVFKPVVEHDARSEILIALSLHNYNSSELSKLLNKNQSGLHRHLLYLKKNKWLYDPTKIKNEGIINYDKITEEFLDYFIKHIEDKKIKKEIDKKAIIEERFFSSLISKFLKHYAETKEKKTLEDIFKEIPYILLLWSFKNQTNEQNTSFSKKFPQSYMFCLVSLNIIDLETYHKKILMINSIISGP